MTKIMRAGTQLTLLILNRNRHHSPALYRFQQGGCKFIDNSQQTEPYQGLLSSNRYLHEHVNIQRRVKSPAYKSEVFKLKSLLKLLIYIDPALHRFRPMTQDT